MPKTSAQLDREIAEVLASPAGTSSKSRTPKMRGKRLKWAHDRFTNRHIAETKDRDRYTITERAGTYSALFMPAEAQHGSLESTIANTRNLGVFDSLGEAQFAAHEDYNGRGAWSLTAAFEGQRSHSTVAKTTSKSSVLQLLKDYKARVRFENQLKRFDQHREPDRPRWTAFVQDAFGHDAVGEGATKEAAARAAVAGLPPYIRRHFEGV